MHQVGKGHAPGKGGQQAAHGHGPVPADPPAGAVPLVPELEADAPHDQGGQHDEQREVKTAEHAGVPDGKGGKGRAGRDDQPHLVAVPDGADGVPAEPPVHVVATDGQVEHAHAEVKAL